jgi:hypothetical protein
MLPNTKKKILITREKSYSQLIIIIINLIEEKIKIPICESDILSSRR